MRLAGERERVFTTDEIASEFAISRNHLTKVVRKLAEAGFVATHRGAGGGFRLARPAAAISIGDVVRRLETRHAIVECFRSDGGHCVLTPQCRLRIASHRHIMRFLQSWKNRALPNVPIRPAVPRPRATGGPAAAAVRPREMPRIPAPRFLLE